MTNDKTTFITSKPLPKGELNVIVGKPIYEPSWVTEARYNRENREMLINSARLALLIIGYSKEQNLSKQDIASKMNLTVEQVDSFYHGSYNFDLKTICDLEKVFGKQLIKINCEF